MPVAAHPSSSSSRPRSSSSSSSAPSVRRMVSEFVVESRIGSGSFATVWRGFHKETGQLAAIKSVSKDKIMVNKKHQENLDMEIMIMSRLTHNNIVRLYEVKVGSGRRCARQGALVRRGMLVRLSPGFPLLHECAVSSSFLLPPGNASSQVPDLGVLRRRRPFQVHPQARRHVGEARQGIPRTTRIGTQVPATSALDTQSTTIARDTCGGVAWRQVHKWC